MMTNDGTSASSPAPVVGDRFRCSRCGLEVEVTAAGEDGLAPAGFHCCGRPLVHVGRAKRVETREAFIEQMQAGLGQARDTIAWLKEKAGQAGGATREELSRDVQILSQQYEKLRESLGEMKDSSGGAWQDMAKGCRESWRRFAAACQKAASRYR